VPPSTTFDEPPEFDVGDRVVTVDPVGPRWRRVPRGSAGIVVARTAERLVAVHFDSSRVEHVHPALLTYEEPGTGGS
jgi:Xrn1 SH3-like domain